MDNSTKIQLKKRLKSLGWRLGAMVAVFVISAFIEQILPLLEIAPEIKTVIGLILGEITKYLNK